MMLPSAVTAGSGAEIFAVGVGPEGDVSPETLFAISFDPDDPSAVFDSTNPDPYYSDHVFHADNFDDLLSLMQGIVDAVLFASQTVVTAEGGSSTEGILYNMTAVTADEEDEEAATIDEEAMETDWSESE